MQITLIQGHLFNAKTWQKTAEQLAEAGIRLSILQQLKLREALTSLERFPPQIVLADLFKDHPGYEEILTKVEGTGLRLTMGGQMPSGFTNLSAGDAAKAQAYFKDLDLNNYCQGMRFLAGLAGMEINCSQPAPVHTHGLFHPQAHGLFPSGNDYLAWLADKTGLTPKRNLICVLCYHGQILEENYAELSALALALQEKGMVPYCVYYQGMADSALPVDERYPWLGYLETVKDDLAGIINATAGRFLCNENDTGILKDLDVPVFQGIRLHRITPTEWLDDPRGASPTSLVYSFAQPEISGVIEPTLLAGEDQDSTDEHHFAPVMDRIDHLALRVSAWTRLRNLPNSEKHLALVLHNNPCRGVEATTGQALGLDAAQSAVDLMHRLTEAGYGIEQIPESGQALLKLIDDKKAISEFRWTTVDQIVGRGGALHLMPKGEYEPWFETLPLAAREKVIEDWGPFPGEGMTLEQNGMDHLVITGLRFGRLTLLVQPKRGCYGAKCNGEVCRILHDPGISPPHHWLATYKFIQDNNHAVIHLGTEGALEYLPGKAAALSGACFPEISLGCLPNIYVYAMDVPGEGLTAKRRSRAVIIDHLTPARIPSPDSEPAQKLRDCLGQYRRAASMNDRVRAKEILGVIEPLLLKLKFIQPGYTSEDLDLALETAARQLDAKRAPLMSCGLHILGRAPDEKHRNALLANMLESPPDGLPGVTELMGGGDMTRKSFEDLCGRLKGLVRGGEEKPLAVWLRRQSEKIALAEKETDQVMAALSGRYILPGLGGSLALGKHQALPTGRNFYAQDLTGLPTEAASKVGVALADEMLVKYLSEEGRFPQSVGISLWSSDAFKSDGEVCAQILHLFGMRPIRDSRGQVKKVEPIALEDLVVDTPQGLLRRPRVDVVIQTSGILRDMVPLFVRLMDQAARLAADLDEPEEWNAPRRHNRQRLAELRRNMDEKDQTVLRKLVGSRVFSSQPGAYAGGIGLAIDASAWQNKGDLAEIYVNQGGWAYGREGFGEAAQEVFAAHLSGIEVSYMKQASPEYDLLDCGCYADFQAGMSCAAGALGGKTPKLYWGGGEPGEKRRIRDLKDELERAVRVRLLSQNWLDELKAHNARGAMEVVNKVLTVFRWSASGGPVEPWVFEALTEHLIMNRENHNWLREANPYAFEEMTRRLLEADSRGLWQAGDDYRNALTEAALELEGDMEEGMGQVTGEFQGSQVEVLTRSDVEKWRPAWRIKPQN